MTSGISSSVGAGGKNVRADVSFVQRLLGQHGISPGSIDGVCGPRTLGAILRFQSGFFAKPDGRVDPNGTTWHRFSKFASKEKTQSQIVPITKGTVTASVATKLTTLIPRSSGAAINIGLSAVSSDFMIQQLGRPRETFTADCQPMTNPALRKHVVTQSVGPFNVTGLKPAVESLALALIQVQLEQPAVYSALGTAGMLCCRFIRGSTTAISNHSWGTAIDFKLAGVLDRRGDNQVHAGLALLAPVLNAHGWYWGATFRTEDAMHFEASRSLITKWAKLL